MGQRQADGPEVLWTRWSHVAWERSAPRAENFLRLGITPCVVRPQNPWLVNQFGKIDLPATCPPAVGPRPNNQCVVEQQIQSQFIGHALLEKRRRHPLEYAIIFSLAQPREPR